jgi:hypothetical protein
MIAGHKIEHFKTSLTMGKAIAVCLCGFEVKVNNLRYSYGKMYSKKWKNVTCEKCLGLRKGGMPPQNNDSVEES